MDFLALNDDVKFIISRVRPTGQTLPELYLNFTWIRAVQVQFRFSSGQFCVPDGDPCQVRFRSGRNCDRSVRGPRDKIPDFPGFSPKIPGDFPKILGEIPDFPKISPKLSQKCGKIPISRTCCFQVRFRSAGELIGVTDSGSVPVE
jgi:hypothetical protein